MVLVIHYFTEDVEQKNTHIFMQILMVEEELGKECQVLAVNWVFVAINFKHGQLFLLVPIYLVAGRVRQGADFRVPL